VLGLLPVRSLTGGHHHHACNECACVLSPPQECRGSSARWRTGTRAARGCAPPACVLWACACARGAARAHSARGLATHACLTHTHLSNALGATRNNRPHRATPSRGARRRRASHQARSTVHARMRKACFMRARGVVVIVGATHHGDTMRTLSTSRAGLRSWRACTHATPDATPDALARATPTRRTPWAFARSLAVDGTTCDAAPRASA
jgi:hypothetical protein